MLNNNHLDINSTKQSGFDRSNLQPIFILYSGVISTVALLISFLILGNTWRLTKISQNQLALVQLLDGKSIIAYKADPYQRDPVLIKNYIKDVFGLLFTWNQKLATNDTNKGIALSDGSQVTVSSWEASFAISESFRTTFLKAIAELTPDDVFRGKAQSVLTFQYISEPTVIDRGKWELNLVANLLIITSSHPEGIRIPVNKIIIVEAIDITTDPMPSDTSPIQKAIYNVKQNGLQISEIRDLELAE